MLTGHYGPWNPRCPEAIKFRKIWRKHFWLFQETSSSWVTAWILEGSSFRFYFDFYPKAFCWCCFISPFACEQPYPCTSPGFCNGLESIQSPFSLENFRIFVLKMYLNYLQAQLVYPVQQWRILIWNHKDESLWWKWREQNKHELNAHPRNSK